MTLQKTYGQAFVRRESGLEKLVLIAAALLVAACASKPKDDWNSYYYGGYQMVGGHFEYTGKGEPRDNDDNYVSPNNLVNSTGSGVAAPTNAANQFKPGSDR